MTIIEQLNRDKKIIEMKEYIHERTGEYYGLLFWDGETIEEFRERLKKRYDELKKNDQ